MLKKGTAAILFMSIFPLELTFGADPAPQENTIPYSLSRDICNDLERDNAKLKNLISSNKRNISDLKKYHTNHEKIQSVKQTLSTNQITLESDILFLQSLFGHLTCNKLELNEENSSLLQNHQRNLGERYTNTSSHFAKSSNFKSSIKKDIKVLTKNIYFKIEGSPCSLTYLDYEKASLVTLLKHLFLNEATGVTQDFMGPHITSDKINTCIQTLNTYQKAILGHFATIATMEKTNLKNIDNVKGVIYINFGVINEAHGNMKNLLGM